MMRAMGVDGRRMSSTNFLLVISVAAPCSSEGAYHSTRHSVTDCQTSAKNKTATLVQRRLPLAGVIGLEYVRAKLQSSVWLPLKQPFNALFG